MLGTYSSLGFLGMLSRQLAITKALRDITASRILASGTHGSKLLRLHCQIRAAEIRAYDIHAIGAKTRARMDRALAVRK